MINRFRFAAEQGLAKANFLTSQELVVVQAFALFLVPVRRYDNTRFSWTLTALLVRIGQSLGLHREGTHFAQLKPFDVEMRRRLWWVLCLLDMRSAEEQGTELIISAYWCKVAYVGAIHTVCVLCMYVSQPCVRQHSHINRYTGAKTPPEVSRVLGMSKTSR